MHSLVLVIRGVEAASLAPLSLSLFLPLTSHDSMKQHKGPHRMQPLNHGFPSLLNHEEYVSALPVWLGLRVSVTAAHVGGIEHPSKLLPLCHSLSPNSTLSPSECLSHLTSHATPLPGPGSDSLLAAMGLLQRAQL